MCYVTFEFRLHTRTDLCLFSVRADYEYKTGAHLTPCGLYIKVCFVRLELSTLSSVVFSVISITAEVETLCYYPESRHFHRECTL